MCDELAEENRELKQRIERLEKALKQIISKDLHQHSCSLSNESCIENICPTWIAKEALSDDANAGAAGREK